MKAFALLRQAQRATGRSLSVFVQDVGHGMLAIGHNGLAVLGLAVVGVVAVLGFAAGQADLRHQAESLALEWLQERHGERALANGDLLQAVAEPEAIQRATATDPADLPRQQAAVAQWLARRYKVAPEPVSALVQEAWKIGQRASLDPTLILAIMAIESSFNPFAQSPVGAQGLMQVMTRVHDDKYEAFGGNHAAFDPISNLRVGVQVLKECIRRAGNLQDGLKAYVGAALAEHDGGYASRVMAEQEFLRRVAAGKQVPLTVSNQPAVPREPAAPEADKDAQVALLR
jgi:soluble lytic murein transglycosylase-like protein